MGSPPPAGSEKVVLKFRSVNNIVIAPASTESDNKSGNVVTGTNHTNRGDLCIVIPGKGQRKDLTLKQPLEFSLIRTGSRILLLGERNESFALGKRFAVAKLTVILSPRAKLRPRLLVTSGRLFPSPEIQVSTGKDLLIPCGQLGSKLPTFAELLSVLRLIIEDIYQIRLYPLQDSATLNIPLDMYGYLELIDRAAFFMQGLSFTGLLSACAKEQENGCAKVDDRPKQSSNDVQASIRESLGKAF
ncbi:hypothetical protein KIW84_044191 [Lathyrus oleraceus]|uniref:Uncharacterized protein n=1 Tax=Pisum sativum TaxID=3888 RepID=A0A9D4XHN9_PEA|nr:hypothetical protein KIW84_044191 [Pisum sativum]